MLDGVEADCAELKGLLHRRMQICQFEAFQKTENLHIFPPPMLGHAAFHQPAQRREFLRQVPTLERGSLNQGDDLQHYQR